MPVEASSSICDSCGKVLEGEAPGRNCTSCETLIAAESKSCPICGEKFGSKDDIIEPQKPLNNEDEVLLSQLMTWTKARAPPSREDSVEDKKERENALHVLRSLTMGESDVVAEQRMERIERAGEKKDNAETRGKQLVMVGKPFESTLEQNMVAIIQTESNIKEISVQLKEMDGKTDTESQRRRFKVEFQLRELEKKKQSLVSYQSDVLMMGGAYRKLLKEQQGELLKIEAELKKRVEAFRSEVERRKKQKERIRKRVEALDKREEDLSHRFLDLKKRSNEIKAMEDGLKQRQEELKLKENSLVQWEEEISASREADLKASVGMDANPGTTKEKWLAHHQELQADLYTVRSGIVENEKRKQQGTSSDDFLRLENDLKYKENELVERQKELEGLKSSLIEKDNEIEKLKSAASESLINEDTRNILKILDDLLEKLPEEIVDKFAKSDDYLLYEKVLDAYKI
jgi:hypothetical protein